MPIQSSGAISLDDIHQEVGGTANSNCSINDADIRGLIDASDGANTSFNDWYGASNVTPRGLFLGGNGGSDSNVDVIDYVTIASAGNATDFGNLSNGRARTQKGEICSATRCLVAGGNGFEGGASNNANSDKEVDVVEYVEFSSTGNAVDFGNLSAHKEYMAGGSNATRGLTFGGYAGSEHINDNYNVIDYFTIASTGNATDFGDTLAAVRQSCGTAGTTRALVFSGNQPGDSNVIQYVTISSTGNCTDFGDTRGSGRNACAASSNTRAVMSAHDALYWDKGAATDTIPNNQESEYVTIASAGNATDFGNLTIARNNRYSTSNKIRALIGGGVSSFTNSVEYLTIASTGNGTDFGDLTVARGDGSAGSSEHGGIA